MLVFELMRGIMPTSNFPAEQLRSSDLDAVHPLQVFQYLLVIRTFFSPEVSPRYNARRLVAIIVRECSLRSRLLPSLRMLIISVARPCDT